MRDDRSTSHLARLLARLETRQAVIGIIGLGHAGLLLGLRYAGAGFRVLGIDTDAQKVERLQRGDSPLCPIPSSAIAAARVQHFEASCDFSRLTEADAVIICLPTPLNAYREPDLSPVLGALEATLPHLRAGQIISLEGTTFPGMTDEEIRSRLTARGFHIGQDMFLVYASACEAAGHVGDGAAGPHAQYAKVYGADTQGCTVAGMALYRAAFDNVMPVSSTRSAELVKLLAAVQQAVNAALVNELKIIADRMRLDADEVLRVVASQPFGPTPSDCSPRSGSAIEPFHLAWKARQYGVHARFIELAGEINGEMPYWVVGKLTDALNERSRAVKGSRVLVLGIAGDSDDLRASPGIELLEILHHKGAVVAYADPQVPAMDQYRIDLATIAPASTELTPQSVASFDGVVVATGGAAFDYDMIAEHARLIIDTCGVYRTPMSKLM